LNPRVDVILPTTVRPGSLKPAIESVLGQTMPDFHLHIVGDGSGAETAAVISSFSDPRVKYRQFPKGPGYGYAHRNTVLRESSAPVIAYMTDDDLWTRDHLSVNLAVIESEDMWMVASTVAPVHPPDTLDAHFFPYSWRLGPISDFLRETFVGSATIVHRRACFDLAGYWNERLARNGDREFYLRLRRRVPRSRIVDEITLIRFYAMEWKNWHEAPGGSAQARYTERVRDPRWVEEMRRRSREHSPGWRGRWCQMRDFCRFARHSGPRFVRSLPMLLGRA
jgi:glycosyltransferase involved in cell wall biosynthesis